MSNNGERLKLVQLLDENGFEYIGQKGGHRQFKHPITHMKITVPCVIKKNIELSVKRNIKKNKEVLNEKN